MLTKPGAVAPGFVPTDFNRKMIENTDRGRRILEHTPMGRFGDPAELRGPVLWLCSDGASFTTGQALADLALTGRTAADLRRFRLSRFGS